jgi:nitroimidazol reductase NimA-like FMN-containing flavoprotein (pyridoxamine 5'-phosphate oxidase superfamily)
MTVQARRRQEGASSPTGTDVLDRPECLELLARGETGRIAVTMGALPTVLPVSYGLAGEDLVFLAHEGSDLARAAADAVVAFETDHVDTAGGEAWSVVVTGMAVPVTDPAELAALRLLELGPWARKPRQVFIRLATDVVSGRRFHSCPA